MWLLVGFFVFIFFLNNLPGWWWWLTSRPLRQTRHLLWLSHHPPYQTGESRLSSPICVPHGGAWDENGMQSSQPPEPWLWNDVINSTCLCCRHTWGSSETVSRNQLLLWVVDWLGMPPRVGSTPLHLDARSLAGVNINSNGPSFFLQNTSFGGFIFFCLVSVSLPGQSSSDSKPYLPPGKWEKQKVLNQNIAWFPSYL